MTNQHSFLSLFLLCFSWTVLLIPMLVPSLDQIFPHDYSTVVLDREGDILRIFLNNREQWHMPPPNTPPPQKLIEAVIAYEDKRFFTHSGVDPVAVLRALWRNATTGQRRSGASTITMQVARLSRPKSRTIFNKILEAGQAVRMEMHMSKTGILSAYLNNAPYGGNIVGYRTAGLKYFGKEPSRLTWAEAATLAVLPNSPRLIHPGSDSNALRIKRDRLLKRLRQSGLFDSDTLNLALKEPVPDRCLTFSSCAHHLAERIRKFAHHGGIFSTTVSLRIQEQAEVTVKRHSEFISKSGIRNAAALIADTRTGQVLAYVGSQDYFDRNNQGMIDGVTARRSSGSILKPFLYAKAMDAGLILPQSMIPDIPAFYGSFSPANSDRSYKGIVRSSEALQQSLNVPAVFLLRQLGLPEFYDFLKSAGVSSLFREAEEYGLPLILGGAEVTLWDLAMLYRGLGDSGNFSRLSFLDCNRTVHSNKLISEGSWYLTLNMLNELKRPGVEFYWTRFSGQFPMAWKTGTSFGHRDGWAVGVTPQWTIAVWAGNFTGEGNPALTGGKAAGALLFALFGMLDKSPELKWFKRPENRLVPVALCAETGFPAGEHCSETLTAEKPSEAPALPKCPWHKEVYLSSDLKETVCSLCWNRKDTVRQTILAYPPEIMQYLSDRRNLSRTQPPHRAGCPSVSAQNPVSIIYPENNSSIIVPRETDGSFQKVTARAAHSSNNSRLFWYIDEKYIGETGQRHSFALDLHTGEHVLQIIDQEGHEKKVAFSVLRISQ
ncbi:MAG: penicillin-binding protein 1C [Candidatus Wallbacteria bacterium]|nr:penicillin-binding protein 1C [Candidatus Wallbacteria bacterium]